MDTASFKAEPLGLRSHVAFTEIIDRHEAGAYLDTNGKQTDVPIICGASTVYQTSLTTEKMKRERQSLGGLFVGMGLADCSIATFTACRTSGMVRITRVKKSVTLRERAKQFGNYVTDERVTLIQVSFWSAPRVQVCSAS